MVLGDVAPARLVSGDGCLVMSSSFTRTCSMAAVFLTDQITGFARRLGPEPP